MDETISPSSLRDFEIIKQIGKGSFGTVFKVRRKSDNTIYAMKSINISQMDKKTLTNTLNELRILCSLDHPNVVAYKDAFIEKDGRELCVIMEFVGGGDLSVKVTECKKKRFFINEDTIWKYIYQILMGLKALHSMKIIHRDIKSANLFLSEDFETIKLGDLNVAKIAKNDMASTQIGTPYYLAPEIWENKLYDYRCDIFSLGCVIYEMASLRVPFEAMSIQDLYKKITKGMINRIPSQYSEELYNCIKLFLTKDPKNRPNVTDALNMPILRQKFDSYKPLDIVKDKRDVDKLLETIVVPRHLGQLKNKLPKKKYRAQSCRSIRQPDADEKVGNKEPSYVDRLISKINENKINVQKIPDNKAHEGLPDKYVNYISEKNEQNNVNSSRRLPPVKVARNPPPVKPPVAIKNPVINPVYVANRQERHNEDRSDNPRQRNESPKVMQYKEYLKQINDNVRISRENLDRYGKDNRFNAKGGRQRVSSADPVARQKNAYQVNYRPLWWA